MYDDPHLGDPLIMQVHVDITELKRTEAALLAARAAVQDAMRRGGAGTWRWDVRADCIEWDAATVSLLAVPPAQSTSGSQGLDDVLPLVHEDDRDKTLGLLRMAASEGLALRFDARLLDGETGPRWIGVRGTVERDAEGDVAAVSGW
ncbi:MAG: hypothetical protein IPM80_05310 [Proteobacteria bacterium]|nr:hypothetical protein [Pseudomonadota bacterium]